VLANSETGRGGGLGPASGPPDSAFLAKTGITVFILSFSCQNGHNVPPFLSSMGPGPRVWPTVKRVQGGLGATVLGRTTGYMPP